MSKLPPLLSSKEVRVTVAAAGSSICCAMKHMRETARKSLDMLSQKRIGKASSSTRGSGCMIGAGAFSHCLISSATELIRDGRDFISFKAFFSSLLRSRGVPSSRLTSLCFPRRMPTYGTLMSTVPSAYSPGSGGLSGLGATVQPVKVRKFTSVPTANAAKAPTRRNVFAFCSSAFSFSSFGSSSSRSFACWAWTTFQRLFSRFAASTVSVFHLS